MADVNANINVLINTQGAVGALKNLQAQINNFNRSVAAGNAAMASSQKQLTSNLASQIAATKAFSTSFQTVETSASRLQTAIDKNRLSLGEYFRYGIAASGKFGAAFDKEHNQIMDLAADRVKRLQTQYLALGQAQNGVMQTMAVRPLQLHNADAAVSIQRQQLFNKLLRDGATSMVNWGKNTQWAGRQLMVGFTVPLTIFGGYAASVFMDLDRQITQFKRVYGDAMTPTAEADAMVRQIQDLAEEYTKYGITVADSIEMAAKAAATGLQGADLLAATEEALRLATLGQMDYQQALDATISLQSAFAISSQDLATEIDFLNAVENQTIVSLDDISQAIPRVAPVIKGLGGDVRDLAAMLAAMREGGVNAAEGANALKSGLASLINPSKQANEVLSEMGINLEEIVKSNEGDLMGTVQDFARAIQDLSNLDRQKALATLFGKYQFARMGALFKNIIRDGSQAQRVIDLAGMSIQELAALSEKDLGRLEESVSVKFLGAFERLKLAIAPIGEEFLKIATPIIEWVTDIFNKFNDLSPQVKKWGLILIAALGGVLPVLVMVAGLFGNFLGQAVKGAAILKSFFNKILGGGKSANYLEGEMLDATAASNSLEGASRGVTQALNVQREAVEALARAYATYLRGASAAMTGAEAAVRGAVPPKPPGPGGGPAPRVPAVPPPGPAPVGGTSVVPPSQAAKAYKYTGTYKNIPAHLQAFGYDAKEYDKALIAHTAATQGVKDFYQKVYGEIPADISKQLDSGNKVVRAHMQQVDKTLDKELPWHPALWMSQSEIENQFSEILRKSARNREFLGGYLNGLVGQGATQEEINRILKKQQLGLGLNERELQLQAQAIRRMQVDVDANQDKFKSKTKSPVSEKFLPYAYGVEKAAAARAASGIAPVIRPPADVIAANENLAKASNQRASAERAAADSARDAAAASQNLENASRKAAATTSAAAATTSAATSQSQRKPTRVVAQPGIYSDIATRQVFGPDGKVIANFENDLTKSGKNISRDTAESGGRIRKSAAAFGGALMRGGAKMQGTFFALDGLLFALSFMDNQIGEIANQALPFVFGLQGLSALFRVMMNPVGLAIGAVAALAGAGVFLKMRMDAMASAAQEAANALVANSEVVSETAEFYGNEPITADARTKQLSETAEVVTESIEQAREFLSTEVGQEIANGLSTAVSEFGQTASAEQFASSLATMMLQGAINFDQAKAMATVLADSLGDESFAVQVIGELKELVGPNGKRIEDSPFAVAIDIQTKNEQFISELEVMMAEANKVISAQLGGTLTDRLAESMTGGMLGSRFEEFLAFQTTNPESATIGFLDQYLQNIPVLKDLPVQVQEGVQNFVMDNLPAAVRTGLVMGLSVIPGGGAALPIALTAIDMASQATADWTGWVGQASRSYQGGLNPAVEEANKLATQYASITGNVLAQAYENLYAAQSRTLTLQERLNAARDAEREKSTKATRAAVAAAEADYRRAKQQEEIMTGSINKTREGMEKMFRTVDASLQQQMLGGINESLASMYESMGDMGKIQQAVMDSLGGAFAAGGAEAEFRLKLEVLSGNLTASQIATLTGALGGTDAVANLLVNIESKMGGDTAGAADFMTSMLLLGDEALIRNVTLIASSNFDQNQMTSFTQFMTNVAAIPDEDLRKIFVVDAMGMSAAEMDSYSKVIYDFAGLPPKMQKIAILEYQDRGPEGLASAVEAIQVFQELPDNITKKVAIKMAEDLNLELTQKQIDAFVGANDETKINILMNWLAPDKDPLDVLNIRDSHIDMPVNTVKGEKQVSEKELKEGIPEEIAIKVGLEKPDPQELKYLMEGAGMPKEPATIKTIIDVNSDLADQQIATWIGEIEGAPAAKIPTDADTTQALATAEDARAIIDNMRASIYVGVDGPGAQYAGGAGAGTEGPEAATPFTGGLMGSKGRHPGNTRKFASGGYAVPGDGGRDSILALLTPGEFVMRKRAVDQYGEAFFRSLNMGAYFGGGKIPRFHKGGKNGKGDGKGKNKDKDKDYDEADTNRDGKVSDAERKEQSIKDALKDFKDSLDEIVKTYIDINGNLKDFINGSLTVTEAVLKGSGLQQLLSGAGLNQAMIDEVLGMGVDAAKRWYKQYTDASGKLTKEGLAQVKAMMAGFIIEQMGGFTARTSTANVQRGALNSAMQRGTGRSVALEISSDPESAQAYVMLMKELKKAEEDLAKARKTGKGIKEAEKEYAKAQRAAKRYENAVKAALDAEQKLADKVEEVQRVIDKMAEFAGRRTDAEAQTKAVNYLKKQGASDQLIQEIGGDPEAAKAYTTLLEEQARAQRALAKARESGKGIGKARARYKDAQEAVAAYERRVRAAQEAEEALAKALDPVGWAIDKIDKAREESLNNFELVSAKFAQEFGKLDRAAQPQIKATQKVIDGLEDQIELVQEKIDELESENEKDQRKIRDLDRQKELIQRTIDGVERLNELDERQISALERQKELIERNISSIERANELDERKVDALDRQKEMLDRQVASIERLNELDERSVSQMERRKEMLDRQLENVEELNDKDQEQIEQLQRQDEIRGRIADSIGRELDLMSRKEADIQEAYDKRIQSLEKVSQINDYIIGQQKSQLGIAQALSQGDIYSATQAMEERRAAQMQFASEQSRTALEQGKQNAISSLRTSGGLTREQAEKQIQDIQDQSYQISLQIRDIEDTIYNRNQATKSIKEQIKNIDKEILSIQDKIYDRQQSIIPIQDQIKGIDDSILKIQDKIYERNLEIIPLRDKILGIDEQILGYQDKIYVRQQSIIPLTDQIRSIDDQILVIQDSIYNRETQILDLQREKLKPLEDQLETQQDILEGQEKDLQNAKDSLVIDGYTYEQLQNQMAAEQEVYDLAVAQIKVNEENVKAIENIVKKWEDVGKAIAEANRLARTQKEDFKEIARTKLENIKDQLRDKKITQEEADALSALVRRKLREQIEEIEAKRKQALDEIYNRYNTPAANYRGGMIKRYGTGNVVGDGSRDSVLAKLTPGEFVVRKSMVDKYGKTMFEQINSGSFALPKYKVGSIQADVKAVEKNTEINAPMYNNYSVNVNVPNANVSADEVANKVMHRIRSMDSSSVRSYRGF